MSGEREQRVPLTRRPSRAEARRIAERSAERPRGARPAPRTQRPPAVQDDPDTADSGRSPWATVAGVLATPGLALWRRNPIAASLLAVAGIIAPTFAVILLFQHRSDLVGLVDRPGVIRGFVIVAVAAIVARLIAVVMSAPVVAERSSGFMSRGLMAVGVLAVPVGFGVVRLEEARAVVQDVFKQGAGKTGVVAARDALTEQIHTILVVGSDEGIGRPGARTDTMMLVFIDRKSGRSALMSIPRALANLQWAPGSPAAEVYPDGYQDKFDSLTNAINSAVENNKMLKAAYDKGDGLPGIHALLEGFSHSFGITINDYAVINSCAFVKIIDAVQGVTVDIPTKMALPHGHFGCLKYKVGESIGPGKDIYLDGTLAFAYARIRSADSDYGRMARQRQLIQALAEQVGFKQVLLNFGQLADAVKGDVKTSMSLTTAKKLIDVLQKGGQKLGGYGLTPPNFRPGSPDWALGHEIIQAIKESLVYGTPMPQNTVLGTTAG